MIRVVTYLLPMSGDMLLEKLDQTEAVEIVAAFVPETYYSDCQSQIHWLKQRNIPHRVPGNLQDESLKKWMGQFNVDYGISVGYDKKLPRWLHGYPDGGTINFHPSLLPDYRGANPYFWTLLNREDQTGVTLHYMDDEFDTGPVIEQQEVPITPDETMGTLFFKLNRLGLNMLQDLIAGINEKNTRPSSTSQPAGKSVEQAPRVQERHLRIDWTEDFNAIESKVRAANPFLGAYTTFRGSKIRLYEVQVGKPPEDAGPDPAPGEIFATDDGPAIRCANEWLQPTVVQVGQRYKSSGREFQRREQKAFDVLNKVV